MISDKILHTKSKSLSIFPVFLLSLFHFVFFFISVSFPSRKRIQISELKIRQGVSLDFFFSHSHSLFLSLSLGDVIIMTSFLLALVATIACCVTVGLTAPAPVPSQYVLPTLHTLPGNNYSFSPFVHSLHSLHSFHFAHARCTFHLFLFSF